MPQRIPMQTVIVRRNGKSVVPEIGKPFDFTPDELETINRVNPEAVRKLVNEGAVASDKSDKKDGRKGGKKDDAAQGGKKDDASQVDGEL